MKKNQKLAVYGAGGVVLLLLLYRYYQSRQAASIAAASTPAGTDPAYASLAGQQQADTAALGGQISGLQATQAAAPTQQDLANLASGLSSTEAGDIGNLTNQIGSLAGTTTPFQQLQSELGLIPGLQAELNKLAAGQTAGNRTRVTPPPGYAFGAKKPKAPKGSTWQGVGAGWYRLVTHPAHAAKPNPHSSNHQPVSAGHLGGHAGGAVAATSHAPKSSMIRKPAKPRRGY